MDAKIGFKDHANRIASGLRRMADDIEREIEGDNLPDQAREIINIVAWGVANLRLGLLTRWVMRVHERSQRDAWATLSPVCQSRAEDGTCDQGGKSCARNDCPLLREVA